MTAEIDDIPPFWVLIYEPNGRRYLGGGCHTIREAREWARGWLSERPGFVATINGKLYKPRLARRSKYG